MFQIKHHLCYCLDVLTLSAFFAYTFRMSLHASSAVAAIETTPVYPGTQQLLTVYAGGHSAGDKLDGLRRLIGSQMPNFPNTLRYLGTDWTGSKAADLFKAARIELSNYPALAAFFEPYAIA